MSNSKEKKMRRKELIVCLIGILLLTFVIVNQVFATSGIDITQANLSGNIANNTNINNTTIRETNSSSNIINPSNNTNNIINNTTNNNTNTSRSKDDGATNSDKLADTGLESTSIFIILVFVISAIYAYKKIREYNV